MTDKETEVQSRRDLRRSRDKCGPPGPRVFWERDVLQRRGCAPPTPGKGRTQISVVGFQSRARLFTQL
jgi:hypothetical protein